MNHKALCVYGAKYEYQTLLNGVSTARVILCPLKFMHNKSESTREEGSWPVVAFAWSG
jgi:hypothetical protein